MRSNQRKIEFQPIISQPDMYNYNADQGISYYFKLLGKNEYVITDTKNISQQLSTLPTFKENEEGLSYDVGSFFINIQVTLYTKMTPYGVINFTTTFFFYTSTDMH